MREMLQLIEFLHAKQVMYLSKKNSCVISYNLTLLAENAFDLNLYMCVCDSLSPFLLREMYENVKSENANKIEKNPHANCKKEISE